MKTARIASLVIAGAIALCSPAARADSLCPEKGKQAAADAQVKQAEDLERAGKAREAYAAAGKADGDCVTDYKRHDALMKRTAKAVGAEEEKKGRFKEAFDWYERAGSVADAGRMQRKLVETSPNDINTVSHAIDFFARNQDGAQEKAMRAHALKNVDKALAAEEVQFASVTKDSLGELGLARDWSYYAKAGEDRVRARAAKRGDALAAEDGRKFLRLALSYYDAAGQPEKEQKVRDESAGPGQEAREQGRRRDRGGVLRHRRGQQQSQRRPEADRGPRAENRGIPAENASRRSRATWRRRWVSEPPGGGLRGCFDTPRPLAYHPAMDGHRREP